MDSFDIIQIILGIILIGFGLLLLKRHKKTWSEYRKSYKSHENPVVDELMRPNEVVYILHLYVLMPISILAGIALIVLTFK